MMKTRNLTILLSNDPKTDGNMREVPVRKVFMLALCASLTGVCPE